MKMKYSERPKKLIAGRETVAIIKRLKTAIKASDFSLRRLCESTDGKLDPPEALHHPVLSNILNHKPTRNLYLQTFLAICKLLNIHPATILFGPQIGRSVELLEKLPEAEQARAMLHIESILSQQRAGTRKPQQTQHRPPDHEGGGE